LSYRIVYGKEYHKSSRRNRPAYLCTIMTVGFLCLFLLLVTLFWPEGNAVLRTIFVPGNPDTTLESAETFAQDILGGMSFRNAVTAFCHTVLNHEPIH